MLEGHQTSVVDLHLLEDDESLWSASADCTVRRWDLRTRQPDTTMKHKDWVGAIALVGGGHIATGGREETVRVWDLQTEKVKHVFEGHCDEVSALAVLDDGATIVSASYDCTIRRWDLAEAEAQKKAKQSAAAAGDKKQVEADAAVTDAPKKDAEGGVQLTAEEEAELAELMD